VTPPELNGPREELVFEANDPRYSLPIVTAFDAVDGKIEDVTRHGDVIIGKS